MFRVGDEIIRLRDKKRFIVIYIEALFIWVVPFDFTDLSIIKIATYEENYSLTGRSIDLKTIVLSELGLPIVIATVSSPSNITSPSIPSSL